MTEQHMLADAVSAEVPAIVDVAQQAAGAEVIETSGDRILVAAPAGAGEVRLELWDLSGYADRPERKDGTVQLYDAASFAAYVAAHREAGTQLYADERAAALVAVLDDHVPEADSGEGAGWRCHRAELVLRHTPEWTRWADLDGELLGQRPFAELVEERMPDVADPPGADLLEIVNTFQAQRTLEFRSAQRLASGEVQLTYNEQTDERAGSKGDMRLPAQFTLGLAPYEGSAIYEVHALLRYRIREGGLRIGYQLVRPHDVARAAFREAIATAEEQLQLAAYRGCAPQAVGRPLVRKP